MKESRCNGLNCSRRLLLLQHFYACSIMTRYVCCIHFTNKKLFVCVWLAWLAHDILLFCCRFFCARRVENSLRFFLYWESLMTHTRSSRNVCSAINFAVKTLGILLETNCFSWVCDGWKFNYKFWFHSKKFPSLSDSQMRK